MPKRKIQNEERNAVVKCGLRTSVRDQSFLAIIDEYILNISRRIHRAGLLLNHYLLKSLESNTTTESCISSCIGDQMLYYSALSLGKRTKYPELVHFFEENAYMYDSIENMSGYGSALNSAAKSMKTNVNNYLFMTFDQRILRMLRGYTKSEKNAILRRIRSYECRTSFVFRENDQLFIDTCKAILEAGDTSITDDWILNNPAKVLRLFRHIIQQCERNKSKSFSILPIFHMKRHFITIDAEFLRNIMVKMNLIPKTCDSSTFQSLKEEHFRSMFKLRKTWNLGSELKTDGIALCINVIRNNGNDDYYTKSKRKKKSSGIVNQNVTYGDDMNYFANDPGNVNLASIIQVHNGEVVDKVTFRKRRYTKESNIKINTAKRQELDKFVEHEMATLSQCCTKTSYSSTLESYLLKKVPMYDKLWGHYGDNKFARLSFDTYIRSCSSIDGFFSKLAKSKKFAIGNKHEKPLLKFGQATWDPGKGWTSGPTKRMIFHARKFFRVVLVDEYNTTKTCCTCGCKMEPLKQKFVGPLKKGEHRWNVKCRGLMRCRSNVCQSVPLKSRDYNAAINIGKAWPNRPSYLCRPLDMFPIQYTNVGG